MIRLDAPRTVLGKRCNSEGRNSEGRAFVKTKKRGVGLEVGYGKRSSGV